VKPLAKFHVLCPFGITLTLLSCNGARSLQRRTLAGGANHARRLSLELKGLRDGISRYGRQHRLPEQRKACHYWPGCACGPSANCWLMRRTTQLPYQNAHSRQSRCRNNNHHRIILAASAAVMSSVLASILLSAPERQRLSDMQPAQQAGDASAMTKFPALAAVRSALTQSPV